MRDRTYATLDTTGNVPLAQLGNAPGGEGTVILDGSGPPADSLGEVGDYYLDIDNDTLYGPKSDTVAAPQERMLPDTMLPNTAAGDYTLASEFTPTANGLVTHLRYYHYGGVYGAHPAGHSHALSLWEVAGGTKIGGVIDSPPDGAPIAQREVALATPVGVTAGLTYRVSYSSDNAAAQAASDSLTPASLAPHLTLSTVSYYGLGRDVYPTNAQGSVRRSGDVVYQEGAGSAVVWPVAMAPAAAGGAEAYHHVQSTAATTWTVNHLLGRHPVVSVLDSAGSQVEVSVAHTSLDQLVLTLSYAVSGTADCS